MNPPTPRCPECKEYNTERESDDSEHDYVCSDCGHVWKSGLGIKQSSGDRVQNDSRVDSDGWEAWFPCPECGSTEFKQTQITTVYGSESGDYDGEDITDQFEKIECSECGEVIDK